MEWTVICRPVVNNPSDTGRNESGLAVVIVNNDADLLDDEIGTFEVARVAFDRRNAPNPDVSFVEALQNASDRAEEAVITLNELDREFDRIRAEAVAKARAVIEELFVNVPGQQLV